MGVHWRGTGGWGGADHRGYSHRVGRLLQVQTQVRGQDDSSSDINQF